MGGSPCCATSIAYGPTTTCSSRPGASTATSRSRCSRRAGGESGPCVPTARSASTSTASWTPTGTFSPRPVTTPTARGSRGPSTSTATTASSASRASSTLRGTWWTSWSRDPLAGLVRRLAIRAAARPDEQQRARRVVDDEALRVADRLRAHVARAAGGNEQVGVARGVGDDVLDPPAGEHAARFTPQPPARGLQERLRGLGGEALDALFHVRPGMAAEQSGERAPLGPDHLARGDRDQRDVRRSEPAGRVDARLPARLGQPHEHPHV